MVTVPGFASFSPDDFDAVTKALERKAAMAEARFQAAQDRVHQAALQSMAQRAASERQLSELKLRAAQSGLELRTEGGGFQLGLGPLGTFGRSAKQTFVETPERKRAGDIDSRLRDAQVKQLETEIETQDAIGRFDAFTESSKPSPGDVGPPVPQDLLLTRFLEGNDIKATTRSAISDALMQRELNKIKVQQARANLGVTTLNQAAIAQELSGATTDGLDSVVAKADELLSKSDNPALRSLAGAIGPVLSKSTPTSVLGFLSGLAEDLGNSELRTSLERFQAAVGESAADQQIGEIGASKLSQLFDLFSSELGGSQEGFDLLQISEGEDGAETFDDPENFKKGVNALSVAFEKIPGQIAEAIGLKNLNDDDRKNITLAFKGLSRGVRKAREERDSLKSALESNQKAASVNRTGVGLGRGAGLDAGARLRIPQLKKEIAEIEKAITTYEKLIGFQGDAESR